MWTNSVVKTIIAFISTVWLFTPNCKNPFANNIKILVLCFVLTFGILHEKDSSNKAKHKYDLHKCIIEK